MLAVPLLHASFVAQRLRWFGPPPFRPTTRKQTREYIERRVKEWNGARGFAISAELGGRWAGFLFAEVRTDSKNFRTPRRFAEIQELHVLPKARRRGVGTMLMAAAESEFRKRGCRAVRLSTSAFMRPARALYLGRGYRELQATLEKRLR